MHKARARVLVEPAEETAMEPAGAAEAQGAEARESEEPVKLKTVSVTVLEPPRSRVKEGKIRLFSSGRTRSSSTRSSTSSGRGWWGKDVWAVAELYLTPTTLCYTIEGIGVCGE